VLREFSPLSTGARILPVALSIAVGSVVGGLLATRLGTRTVVVTELISFGTAIAWIAGSVQTDTPYWTLIVPQMLLMGLAMGLIATPATESIMIVLPPARGYRLGRQRRHSRVGLNDGRRRHRLGVLVYFWRPPHRHCLRGNRKGRRGRRFGPGRVQIAAGHPDLLAAAQDSFLSGLAVACTVVAGLCYAAGAAGMVALPGRRFQPPFSTSPEKLESLGMA